MTSSFDCHLVLAPGFPAAGIAAGFLPKNISRNNPEILKITKIRKCLFIKIFMKL
jgi:hypothetical protein